MENNPSQPNPAAGQVRIRVDERDMDTTYANSIRTSTTAEEVLLDFGLNAQSQPRTDGDQPGQPEMLFKVNDRVIMNFYTAKRLAMSLSQIVRRHEEQFGELKLNPAERVTDRGN